MTAVTDAYFSDLIARLASLKDALAEPMARAEDAIVETARRDGLVYVFGTGHSHMLAEEVHFRAGGLALTVPILATATMLHGGAVMGTAYERMEGIVGPIMDRYPIGPDDVLFVISNSGINAVPLEAARIGKQRGATVIAITSVEYSTASAKGRERLADIADIVLDNGAPPGDAVISVPNSELKVGPVSTAIGVTIIDAIMASVAARLSGEGGDAPIYLSANMPGAKQVNEKLVARFRPRNPHL